MQAPVGSSGNAGSSSMMDTTTGRPLEESEQQTQLDRTFTHLVADAADVDIPNAEGTVSAAPAVPAAAVPKRQPKKKKRSAVRGTLGMTIPTQEPESIAQRRPRRDVLMNYDKQDRSYVIRPLRMCEY